MKNKNELYRKHNYLNEEIVFLRNVPVREYDLSEGGFSLIKYFNLLSKSEIEKLDLLTKNERLIQIGKMQIKNTSLSKNLMLAFVEARKMFFEANDLDDDDILSIKKDAIFVINKSCKETDFDILSFKLKNFYSSFLIISNIEFYYNSIKDKLDIKKLGEITHPLFDVIKTAIKLAENNKNEKTLFTYLQNFIKQYLNKSLQIEFYKELRFDGMFKYKYELANQSICLDSIDLSLINDIDISYNYLKFIIPLVQNII